MRNMKPKRVKLDDVNDMEMVGDYVLVETHESEDRTEGGIIIPDKAQQQSWRGTVLRVGPGKTTPEGKRLPMLVQVGDVVIYRNFQGWHTAEIKGTNYYAVSGEERIAVIPKSKVVYE